MEKKKKELERAPRKLEDFFEPGGSPSLKASI